MKMRKACFRILIVFVLTLVLLTKGNFNTIDAKKADYDLYPVFTETITLQNRNSKFDVGFVTVQFNKNCVDEDLYPLTFDIEVYAEDGVIYIEFSPDVEEFFKDVTIHVHHYEGFIYDVALDEYIYVDIDNTVFRVDHFSRWAFVR